MKNKFAKEPNFTEKKDYRPSGVQETGLAFIGHEISDDKKVMNQFLHYDQLYTIRHGRNSPFFIGLLDGKLMGMKCPKCGDTFLPVRGNCWNLDCNLQETEWIELRHIGKVHTWTVAGWSGRSSLKRLPIILVYGIIDGCKVAIANEMRNMKPWDIEFGMDFKVEFIPKEERTGAVTDFYFVPEEGWKPGPMTEEKERIKNMVQPVYEWVKSME